MSRENLDALLPNPSTDAPSSSNGHATSPTGATIPATTFERWPELPMELKLQVLRHRVTVFDLEGKRLALGKGQDKLYFQELVKPLLEAKNSELAKAAKDVFFKENVFLFNFSNFSLSAKTNLYEPWVPSPYVPGPVRSLQVNMDWPQPESRSVLFSPMLKTRLATNDDPWLHPGTQWQQHLPFLTHLHLRIRVLRNILPDLPTDFRWCLASFIPSTRNHFISKESRIKAKNVTVEVRSVRVLPLWNSTMSEWDIVEIEGTCTCGCKEEMVELFLNQMKRKAV